ncbi:hypothetical protein RRG08_059543 [Elysia crispata]|uniref:C-type lectin domain-containing protein n=1 Tax=Elysia crispata TaxID=231223 RepID=A0AAE1DQI9_9GAST|nr:hypothetical protein RRG08_059543 [Elysia crispata]
MKLQQISISLSIGCVISFFILAHECIADFSCSTGWKSINPFSAKCINVSTSTKKWDEARKSCQAYGGDLVQISNMLELNHNLVCENNTYGPNCLDKCSPYCDGANSSCDRINGSCIFGCLDGYQGAFCDSVYRKS